MTNSLAIRYLVEIYGLNFENNENDLGFPSIVLGSAINDNISPHGAKVDYRECLKRISFVRDKSKPNSDCAIKIQGNLPVGITPGVWVVVTSVSQKESTKTDTSFVKWIGQIYSVEVSYDSMSNGLLSVSADLLCREWSSTLLTPIRFDDFSMIADTLRKTPENLIGALSDLTSSSNSKKDNQIDELIKNQFDPFLTIHTVLALCGMISEIDYKASGSNIKDYAMLALMPPKVPTALLKRLGIPTDTKNSFSKGFCKVATGLIPNNAIYLEGWNGVMNSIDDYAQDMFDRYTSAGTRPSSNATPILSQTSFTAWELISNHCEPDLMDVYTDMWYEEPNDYYLAKSIPKIGFGFEKPSSSSANGAFDVVYNNAPSMLLQNPPEKEFKSKKKISSRPVVVVRDKPYHMRRFIGNLNDPDLSDESVRIRLDQGNHWSFYDDIPRINIPSSNIVNARFSWTFLNSPNYIRVNIANHNNSPDIQQTVSRSYPVRLDSLQEKFGGYFYEANSTFFGFGKAGSIMPSGMSGGDTITSWHDHILHLVRRWHSYRYKMPDCNLTLKTPTDTLSVGFNLQFNINEWNLVGQIERIAYDIVCDESGLDRTTISVGLSRVCIVRSDGILDFIPDDVIGTLNLSPKKETKNSIAMNYNSIKKKALDMMSNLV